MSIFTSACQCNLRRRAGLVHRGKMGFCGQDMLEQVLCGSSKYTFLAHNALEPYITDMI